MIPIGEVSNFLTQDYEDIEEFMNAEKHINLYKSFFRGRTDIYAVRWGKDGRSGYMPAYKVDWTDYNKLFK